MATITYTAKRNIAPLVFNVAAAIDISAAAADDSFNATSSDLSGLLSGQWVYVSGFANAANNGWHQLAANSTITKIQTTSTLVTESAGPAITLQGYRHGLNQQYTLETRLRDYTPQPDIIVSTVTALGGNVEAVYQRTDAFWSVSTDTIDDADRDIWIEFFRSVSAAESFLFDAYGTVSVPDNPVNVILNLANAEKWSRFKTLRKWLVSFGIKEV
jgi:hypothetical protein